MTRDELLKRLRTVPRNLARLSGDENHPVGSGMTPAAVLVGIVPRGAVPHVILTQRTEHLRDHAGQISFPGGRVEPQDNSTADTALREAHEEIGLEPGRVEIIAHLPAYHTVTGFRVEPVVGWIDEPNEFQPDPHEVADVFEVPLSFIIDVRNHQRASRFRHGQKRNFYVLPYEGRYIWGATAGMLVNFANLLNAEV